MSTEAGQGHASRRRSAPARTELGKNAEDRKRNLLQVALGQSPTI